MFFVRVPSGAADVPPSIFFFLDHSQCVIEVPGVMRWLTYAGWSFLFLLVSSFDSHCLRWPLWCYHVARLTLLVVI